MQQAEIAAKQVQLVAQQELLADGLAQKYMAVAKVVEFTVSFNPTSLHHGRMMMSSAGHSYAPTSTNRDLSFFSSTIGFHFHC
jgi:hypothetical protein